MIFMESFFCGEANSVPLTPTTIEPIKYVTLSSAWFDDIRMTRNLEEEVSDHVQQFWDYDTIMHAKFDGDTYAGNVKWDLERVSYLLIKRKKTTDFKWTTIDYKDVQDALDVAEYNLEGIDITATPGYTYQYAVVGVVDNVEDEYSIDTVEVKCHGIVIADATALYFTYLTDMYLDNVSVTPNAIVETMYDRFPTIVRNTLANYENVTVNAEFLPFVDECNFEYGDDVLRTKYNKEVKMFLRNGYTKILKCENGQIWLGYITTPPSDSADQVYYTRKVTFTLTETGEPDSEKYLYKAGIIDVPQTFWSYDN